MASFEGKVQHVNQGFKSNNRLLFTSLMKISPVYKTDIEESEAIVVTYGGDEDLSPISDPRPTLKDDISVSEILEPTILQDVPEPMRDAELVSPAKGPSKTAHGYSFPHIPRESIGIIRPFDDIDELSEISEFEPENNPLNELVATGTSTARGHEMKHARDKIDCVQRNGRTRATTAMGINKPLEFTSKTDGHAEGIIQRSPETGKLLLTSDPPISGSSSSTQINVSPKSPPNADTPLTTVESEAVDGLSITFQDFVGAGGVKKSGVNEYGPFCTGSMVASAGTPQTWFSPTGGAVVQHANRFTLPSNADKKNTRGVTTKDTSVPTKISGKRRKRETTKSSSKAIIEVDDELAPPCKRSRDDRLGIKEDKTTADKTSLDASSISGAKRYTNTDKNSFPGTDPTIVDFNELQELEPTYQGTRRSSRIKKKKTAATARTRANPVRGKTQEGNQTDG